MIDVRHGEKSAQDSNIESALRHLLPGVSKPARYAGHELGIIAKDWERAPVHMALAFPDVYEIGMSHLGGRILYGLVNETTPHLAERVFAPWPDFESALRDAGIPLYSLESFRPLGDFDVVGFSLQYELSITNCLNMLDLAGIPVAAEQRGKQDPLVIAGGPVCFNPEPYADFFDLFVIGEAEEILPRLLERLAAVKHLERSEQLLELARLPGIYAPVFYLPEYNDDGGLASFAPQYSGLETSIAKGLIADLDSVYYPERPILPYINIVHDRASIEVMRGCQRACRFCQAGSIYRPLREKSLNVLQRQAAAQLASTGYDEIALSSLSSLDYSCASSLVRNLIARYSDEGIGVSLPSLRVDAVSVDIAGEIQKVRKTTLTLAPEAGSQRMRDIINKNVSETEILEAVTAAFASGWLGLKLYFMLGLPGEKMTDLDATLELLCKISRIGRELCPRKFEVRASFAYFVPKAHTPFQWCVQDRPEQFREKSDYLKKHRIKNVKMSFHDERTSFLEGLLARGDRRLGKVILAAWQNGCRLDGWSEHFHFEGWLAALKYCGEQYGINPEWYLYRHRSYTELLPWDFVNTGIERNYLIEENERSRQGLATADCREEGCVDCGVCDNLGVSLQIKPETDS